MNMSSVLHYDIQIDIVQSEVLMGIPFVATGNTFFFFKKFLKYFFFLISDCSLNCCINKFKTSCATLHSAYTNGNKIAFFFLEK